MWGNKKSLELKEKAAMTSGKDAWSFKSVSFPELPSLVVTDGPHGVRLSRTGSVEDFDSTYPATCFPTAAGLGSSWNRELIEKVGRALGEECLALGVQILLGPGVNIKRSPLGGRNFEYYSEDPVLAGELAACWINGVQSTGVGTSLKHFAVNNQEFERMTVDVIVEERALREIYLKAFEIPVKKAQPWTVMCAYNKVNGIPASEHKQLLTDILKEEWGFDGIVVSDWGAVNDRTVSIKNGLDMEMPGGNEESDKALWKAAGKDRELRLALEKSVQRIIRTTIRGADGIWEDTTFSIDRHHKLAREAAAESMVLLKNDKNILPLQADKIKKLAVIGLMAEEPRYQGAGSSLMHPTQLDIPLECIKTTLGEEGECDYAPGYNTKGETSDALVDEAVKAAEASEEVILFAGLPSLYESEGYDRKDMKLPEGHLRLIEEVSAVNSRTIVVLCAGSLVQMSPWGDKIPAILAAWLFGQGGGQAVSDLLFGLVSPSGRLAETLPERIEDTSSFINFPGEEGRVLYGEGVFVGYRWFDKTGINPRFPFGYGLSYSQFEYSDISCGKNALGTEGKLTIGFSLTNTGKRQAKEVCQLYVQPPEGSLIRPLRELKSFIKVELNSGESRELKLEVAAEELRVYSAERKEWIYLPGNYTVLIGSNSRDLPLSAQFELKVPEWRRTFSRETLMKYWFEDEQALEALEPLLETPMGERFLEKHEDKPLWRDMLMDAPIFKLIQMSGGIISEEILDFLVAKANGNAGIGKGIKAGISLIKAKSKLKKME